jgi:uncharacterized Fe-S cluster protein YjdI
MTNGYDTNRAQRHAPGRLMTTKRLQVYDTTDIMVTFDPEICQHTGACVRGLPAVFDVKRKRWVSPEAATSDEVAAQVSRCPSGALQYQLHKKETS